MRGESEGEVRARERGCYLRAAARVFQKRVREWGCYFVFILGVLTELNRFGSIYSVFDLQNRLRTELGFFFNFMIGLIGFFYRFGFLGYFFSGFLGLIGYSVRFAHP